MIKTTKEVSLNQYLHLLFPLLIEQIVIMLIDNANVFLLSFYNDQAVAATGIANQLLSIGTMAMGIVSLGSTILFLQTADDDHIPKIQAIIRQTIILNLLISFVIFIVFLAFGRPLLELLQTPDELLSMALSYLRITSISLLFQGISNSCAAVLRSFGKTRQSMVVAITNGLLVILGNAFVILSPYAFPGGKLVGIGLAMVMTRMIGALVSWLVMRNALPKLFNQLLKFQLEDWKYGRKLLALGIPSGMENVSYNISQTILTGVISSLGMVAITSKIYAQSITAIVFSMAAAMGQATQIVIGQYIRNNAKEKGQAFALKSLHLYLLSSLTLNLLIALAGFLIIPLFTDDPLIFTTVQTLLWMNIIYDACRGINEIIIASLNVVGEVRQPVIVGVLVTYLFTVPLSLIGVSFLNFNLYTIWIIFIVDEFFRNFVFIRKWQSGSWKTNRLLDL